MFSRFITKLTKLRKGELQSKLAIAYAVVAWNGFAIGLYFMIKENNDESNIAKGLHKASKEKYVNRARVIQFDGLTLVEDTIYNKEQLEEARSDHLSKKISEFDDDSYKF